PRHPHGTGSRRRGRGRQHLRGVDPDRPGPRLPGRPPRGGRSGAAHLVRGRTRLGRYPVAMDGTREGLVKIAVVTGGSRGLGRACAEALAGSGWSVAVGYRSNEADAKDALKAIEASGASG